MSDHSSLITTVGHPRRSITLSTWNSGRANSLTDSSLLSRNPASTIRLAFLHSPATRIFSRMGHSRFMMKKSGRIFRHPGRSASTRAIRSSTPFARAFFQAVFSARGLRSTARTNFAPARAHAIARTPVPAPKSSAVRISSDPKISDIASRHP